MVGQPAVGPETIFAEIGAQAKATLAEIAHRLGRKALEEVAATAMPDTILGWYRKLVANKFDGSRFRRSAGRPRVEDETERLVAQAYAPDALLPRQSPLSYILY